MLCPFCRGDDISVVKTIKYDAVVVRFRLCLTCERSFKTAESYDKSIIVEQYSFLVTPSDSK